MDTFETVSKRRSIRLYSSDDILEEDLRKIVVAAAMAPSARNSQNWNFILIRDNNVQRKIMVGSEKRGMLASAPVVIAVCFDSSIDNYGAINAGLAIENLVITATDLGIGSCIVSSYYFDSNEKDNYSEIKKALMLPEKIDVVALVALGYAAEKPSPKQLIPIDELIHLDEYGRKTYWREDQKN